MISRLLLLLMIATLNVKVARADFYYAAEPGAPIDLGLSIDFRDPTSSKRQCIQYDSIKTVELIDLSGVRRVSLSSEYIKDYEELNRKFHLNAHFKSHGKIKGLFSGENRIGFEFGTTFNGFNDEILLAYLAEYDFGIRRIDNPHLKSEYQALLDNGKHDEFVQKCGTHFAIREQRHARVAVVAHALNVNAKFKQEFELDYKSKSDVTLDEISGGTDIGLNFSNEIEKIKKYTAVKLDFLALGGRSSDAAEISSALKGTDLAGAIKGMGTYMKGVTANTSVPASYWLASFGSYGLRINHKEPNMDKLSQLLFMSNYLDAMIKRLNDEKVSMRQANLNTAVLSALQDESLQKAIEEKVRIEEALRECAYEGNCNHEYTDKPEEYWASILLEKSDLQTNCAYTNQYLSEINVSLNGKFLDKDLVDDFEVYSVSDGVLNRQSIDTSTLSRDGRFRTRIDVIQHLLNLNDSNKSKVAAQKLKDIARNNRYLIRIIPKLGPDQWDSLGKTPVSCSLRQT